NKRRTVTLDIKLAPFATILEGTTVTASKYETNPEKSTNSIIVLSPKVAEDRNLTTIDGLLNTAGGLAVVDNEPQIRGGSGFSSGMGSRVLILLDDMPLLRPDAGRPMWTFIPMEDVEQVDIVKGASSVVFGSSALTGAINVHTAYPRSKPKTKVIVYGTLYGDPNFTGDEVYQNSWTRRNPIKSGFNFLHSRIIKKNFDFVIGGEAFYDEGHIGPEFKVDRSRDTAGGSTIGKYEKRVRLNFATRYRFQKVKGLNVSVNGNFMYSDNAQSFFWYDALENRYRTYGGSLSKFKDFTFYVDPTITYNSAKGYNHALRNRIIYSNNQEATGTQDASSISIFNEYQFTKVVSKIGMRIVGGIMNNYAISEGVVFNGIMQSNEKNSMHSDNFAFYAQLEQKFLKKRNLVVEAGMRWEFYQINDEKMENKPVFRAGLNYQVPSSKTSLRASFGQGYRYPSIGEKYISISVGRYGFYPHKELQSEKSWNAEVGVMQPFQLFDFRGMFDLALFHQRYDNYIEFAMGYWAERKPGSNPMDGMGFRYINIGDATIQGIDASFMGEGKISKNVTYTLSMSYTFSHPTCNEPDKAYFTDTIMGRQFTFNNSSSDTSRRVLKYRIEHIAKADLAFTFYKKWSLGVTLSYYSAMRNVDKFFFTYDVNNPDISITQQQINGAQDLPFKGYTQYYNEHLRGSFVLDVRTNYAFSNVTLSFIVKNLLNKSYTMRPMLVEPPRTYTFQLTYNFN
ncbi:MAG: TonB-dependent receptor, partial [Bacteroidales bacterium]|nr:TonB-dependent receptor [Bacteroidales bacterium]